MAEKLRPKYVLFRVDEEKFVKGEYGTMPPVSSPPMLSTDPDDIDSPFVLMPRKDPAAFRALVCYALYCEPDLRAEIATFLEKIADAEPEFGTQGARNYAAMKLQEIRLGL